MGKGTEPRDTDENQENLIRFFLFKVKSLLIMKFFLICLTVMSHFVSSEASMLSRLSKRFAGSRVERAITEEEFIKNQKAFAQNLESVQSLKIERAEPRSDVLDVEEIMVEESADTELKEDPPKLFDVLMPPTNSNEAKQSNKTVNITRSKDDEIVVEDMEKSLKSSEVESKNETNDQGSEIIKVEKEQFVMEDEIFDEVKVQGLNVQDINDDHFEEEEICQHPKFGDVKCNTFNPEMKIANDRSDDLQKIKIENNVIEEKEDLVEEKPQSPPKASSFLSKIFSLFSSNN